jgi:hypothetical protein
MKRFAQKENEYFFDEAIEIISTDIKDKKNRELLKRLNSLLTRARKQLIDKDYDEYFSTTRKAFHAAHDLNNDVLKDYSELFMTFIKDSLAETLTELKIMSSGLFGRKKYRVHVKRAYLLLEEFNNFRIAASDLDSFDISQYQDGE